MTDYIDSKLLLRYYIIYCQLIIKLQKSKVQSRDVAWVRSLVSTNIVDYCLSNLAKTITMSDPIFKKLQIFI